MTDARGAEETDATRDTMACLQEQIRQACATLYQTMSELHEKTERDACMQAYTSQFARYEEQLAALVGTDQACQMLYAMCSNALVQQVQATLHSDHPERVKTLWMLICHESGSEVYEVVPFYAPCEEDAEQQAHQWLASNSRQMSRVNLRSHPHGFTIWRRHLHGKIV